MASEWQAPGRIQGKTAKLGDNVGHLAKLWHHGRSPELIRGHGVGEATVFHPPVFCYSAMQLFLVVHIDDFVRRLGSREVLEKLHSELKTVDDMGNTLDRGGV